MLALLLKSTPASIQHIIQMGIDNEWLRDEIYMQLCKQNNNNPNTGAEKKSRLYCWQLFALTCASFAPSPEFDAYLDVFLRTAEKSLAKNSAMEHWQECMKLAQFARQMLGESSMQGARLIAPTNMEIDALRLRRPVTPR